MSFRCPAASLRTVPAPFFLLLLPLLLPEHQALLIRTTLLRRRGKFSYIQYSEAIRSPKEEKKSQHMCWTLENLPQHSYTKTHLAELAWEWEVQGSQRLPWRTNTDVTWPRRAWSSMPTTRWPKDKVLWDSSHTHRTSSLLLFLGRSRPETTAYTAYDLGTLWASL